MIALRQKQLVLLVDDDAAVRMLAREALEQAGFAVEEAADGETGVAAFERIRPDIILLDVMMPVLDGFKACAALRKLPGGEHVPVLNDPASSYPAYQVGATVFVPKPIAWTLLVHRVRYLLRASATFFDLARSQEEFRQLAGNVPEMFWIADPNSRALIYVSAAYEKICGRPRMLTVYRNVRFDTMDQEYRVVRPDGSVRWVHQRGFPAHDIDGAVARVVGIIEDITERKQMQQDLLHLAHHDNLTHLPNRGLFYDRLSQALAQAHRHEWAVGVMFIDLDRFKIVNDTLGHGVGDLLLQQVAKRLSGCIRAEDTVARLGGDEFAVMLPDLADAQDAAAVARKILGALAAPFQLDGHEVFVTASIGIASYPRDSHDADTLIKHADAAMYRAKDLGKNNYQLYSALLSEQAPERLQLESNLRRALERNEFVLHFQPRANLVTGLITGVEALVRWQLPNGSLVAPADFIPLLEETGLIVPAGEWVLRAACCQVRTWQQDGLEPVPIAVNLSARQFHQQDICEVVTRALHDYAVDPRFLELEITESAAMKNAAEATKTLRALKAIGVHIAIDDFGTGYSSLGYLKRFPIDSLKLDRSFVTDLPDNEEDASIAQAVITMAHALKLKVIAEGVENEAQLAFLAAHGCNDMQGYFLSRPLPAEQCTQLLREKKKLPLQPASADKLKKPPRLELVVSS